MVIWRPAARADLMQLVRYIAEENPLAARKIGRELVAVSPYIIVYEVADDTVYIFRVWHGAQSRWELPAP